MYAGGRPLQRPRPRPTVDSRRDVRAPGYSRQCCCLCCVHACIWEYVSAAGFAFSPWSRRDQHLALAAGIGVALRSARRLTAVLAGVYALILCLVRFANASRHSQPGTPIWPLFLLTKPAWPLFGVRDLFNWYVTLELRGLVAVAMVISLFRAARRMRQHCNNCLLFPGRRRCATCSDRRCLYEVKIMDVLKISALLAEAEPQKP